jgi:hypothetical protein
VQIPVSVGGLTQCKACDVRGHRGLYDINKRESVWKNVKRCASQKYFRGL